jgi:ABC-type transport system substrate-binding protein
MLMAVPSSTICVANPVAIQSPPETVLDIGYMQVIDSLNPFLGLNDMSRVFYGMVYDGLQSIGNDLEPEPNLATSWWIVPETDSELVASGEPYGSVWEYNLTTNANWSDGTPFTADDVVYTMNLQCSGSSYPNFWSNQPYTYFMSYAERLSADKVRMHFFDRSTSEPKPVAFGDSLTMPIVPKHMLDQYSPSYIGFAWNGTYSMDPPIVGTGSFVVMAGLYHDWLTDQNITLVRNADYHGSADYGRSVNFDKIVLHRYYESQAMAYDLLGGVLDIAQLSPEGYLAIKDDVATGNISSVETFDGPKCTNYWTDISFNMNTAGPNPARLDPFVRWAMAMATDKEFIVDNYYHGLADEGSTLISPANSFWHLELLPEEQFEYNLSAAELVLEAAGYRDVNDDGIRECTNESMAYLMGWVPLDEPLTFELIVRQGHPEEVNSALFLQAVYAIIGIDLQIQIVEETVAPTYIYGYDYDMALWYWSSMPDPNEILFAQTHEAWNGWSENKYSDPYFEENYSNSVSALDQAERKAYVDNCQAIFYLDTAYLILAYPYQTYVWRTDGFTGWGNWSADPGRSMDAYWGANPLWFDLTPVSSGLPATEVEIRGTAGENGWFISPVTVYLNASGGLGGVNHTYYRLETGTWQEYTAPFSLSDNGNQTVEYYSVDRDGNDESHKTTYVRIDSEDPIVTSIGLVSESNGSAHWLYILRDSTSGISHSQFSLDNGTSWTTVGNLTNVITGSFPEMGSHNITVRVWDNAGNYAESSLTVTVSEHQTLILGMTWFGFIALLAGVVVVILLIVFLLMRRKTIPPTSGEIQPPYT